MTIKINNISGGTVNIAKNIQTIIQNSGQETIIEESAYECIGCSNVVSIEERKCQFCGRLNKNYRGTA
ncbi:MAG: hypothetical protein KDK45_19360 [Leptospiraceae bacterium]|nr:hypothetical protein [Leptospiraceae bacterium]